MEGPAVIEQQRPEPISPSQAGAKRARLEARRVELSAQLDAAEVALDELKENLLSATSTSASPSDLKKLKREIAEAEKEVNGLRDSRDLIELGIASFLS